MGRLRGLVRDAATQRLFVADAEHNRLLVWRDDLSQQVDMLQFAHQPDQVIFDDITRYLYLSFPAEPQVMVVNADTLTITASTSLVGGPILDLAFDAQRHRLYALNALAPHYRGITIWRTPSLDPIALVAGAEDFSLPSASAMALTPTGQLLISEATGLWQIDPDGFAVSNLYPTTASQYPASGLEVSQNGTIYAFDTQAHQLKIFRGLEIGN
jgi:DNA-binding beta-propeller fold protein YncE